MRLQEHARKREIALQKNKKAAKVDPKQKSMMAFFRTPDDVSASLPPEPEIVPRDRVDIPAPPPQVKDEDVHWWLSSCGNLEREVISQTGVLLPPRKTCCRKQFFSGFSPRVCEQLWVTYGKGLKDRNHLLAVLISLKMNPTVDQLQRVLGMSRTRAFEFIEEGFLHLQSVVDEVKWDDRLSVLNHTSHFPYFVSFCVWFRHLYCSEKL